MKETLQKALRLFLVFFKIGAFTFGGGYAMIPLIQKEVVEKKKWITDDDILEIIAIAESTPGPIAINSATFVGYRVCGFWGSFFATLAFNGIRAGVLALLLKALWTMYKKSPKSVAAYIVMGAAFLLTAFLDVPVLAVIIGCAVFGLITSVIAERRNKV